MKKTALIVNADDFGLTDSINRGIMHAIEKGIVTSVSLAANGRSFTAACRFLHRNPQISAGWHVNLTGGYPVLNTNKVQSLVDRNGLLHGKMQFLFRLLTGRINYRECRAELKAQYHKLVDSGIAITHIDSHHDIHCLPPIAAILQQVCKPEIHMIRYRRGIIHYLENRPVNVLIRILAKIIIPAAPKNRYNSVDFIWFRELYQHPEKLDVVKSCLCRMRNGINLLVCHPGYYDAGNDLHLHYNRDREKELLALCHHEVIELINRMNIELRSSHRSGYEAYI
ncbi:MAG TPA: ChbG/HpnK family deacetylase [bacterium]|nr:ChbG/HpnK family deacetylase [bacterium]HPN44920.1 ChbG/HpnK family deacetylase [bacterium]